MGDHWHQTPPNVEAPIIRWTAVLPGILRDKAVEFVEHALLYRKMRAQGYAAYAARICLTASESSEEIR